MRRFLLISVALHGLAALVLHYTGTGRDIYKLPGNTIHMSLHTISEPVRSRPAPVVPSHIETRTQEKPGAAAPDHDREPAPVAAEHPVARLATGPVPRTEVDLGTEESMQAALRSAVYSELQARFTYPRRARMRGWEGTVVISLRILPDGQLSDVQLADSSGIRVLDDAALQSVSRIRVRHVAAIHGSDGLYMTIPVEYRLTDT